MSRTAALATIHADALAEFDKIETAYREERKQCLNDRRFYSIAGAQWENEIGQQFENKPKIEVNKIHLAIIRIFSEYRNNRITVDFTSKDGTATDDLADTCDGLYRADELDSCAQEAYDNAYEEGVGGGIGAWRLRACYEDEDDDENEKQRIRIEPIYDADSCVFFGLNAKRQDKSDAKSCYVLTAMTPEAFREEYGHDPQTWDRSIHSVTFDWCGPKLVYVAEYYQVVMKKRTVFYWKAIDGTEDRYTSDDFAEDETLRDRLMAMGSREVRKKQVKCREVEKFILSGFGVEEDCGTIAGKHIPIVPTYGKRWVIDGVERCMGHVRLARDAQLLANMLRSKLAEISALSSVAKPILTPEQIAGHQLMWQDDNVKNYPYLLVNPMTDANGQQVAAGPVAYTKPPEIPPALAALLEISEQDIRDLLGNQQAGEEVRSNITEGVVELVQDRLDMQVFIYMSNFAKAMRRSGEIWLSMAKDLYVEEGRKMKTVGSQDELSSVELMRPMQHKDGGTYLENDLSEACYDVTAEVGPASSTKRKATVRALASMAAMTDDPETKQVLVTAAMMNMEGEGLSEVHNYFRRRSIRMGIAKPTDEERAELAEELANQKPDANEEYLRKAGEAEAARAIEARAKTIDTLASADKKQAETIKTMSEVDATEQRQALEVIDRVGASNQLQQPASAPPDQGASTTTVGEP